MRHQIFAMYEILFFLGGIAIGVMIQRIYVARAGPMFEQGSSWRWGKSRFFRWLHRLYCETCPRRQHCPEYDQRVAADNTL